MRIAIHELCVLRPELRSLDAVNCLRGGGENRRHPLVDVVSVVKKMRRVFVPRPGREFVELGSELQYPLGSPIAISARCRDWIRVGRLFMQCTIQIIMPV